MDQTAVRTNSLAYCFQESFTAILRVGSQRQTVQDSESFRGQIRNALRSAMEQSKALGYSSEIIQMSLFAAVAYLDESILNLQSAAFADWSRRPLQEELFGGHTAGEVFFRNLQELLGRQDAPEIADCLEVYCLCLLLGFKGRYALSGGGDLQAFVRQARDKITRIRGNRYFLQTDVPLPEVKRVATIDRWSRGLGITAACLLVIVILAFAGLFAALSSGVSQIQNGTLTAP
jgi:type VI secretion system protein ImpK